MSTTGPAAGPSDTLSRVLLVAGAAFCLFPWGRLYPPLGRFHIELGLGMGVVLALAGLVHAGPGAGRLSRAAIQVCVVLLGFRMDLHEVARAGGAGLLFAIGTIAATFTLGAALGRALRIDGKLTTLVSSGTAICGGSAIAAVATVIGASGAQISVATATVFILNGLALYLFPILGDAMRLSPDQFGAWAGVAIHDISSVVGAAQSFDAAHPPAAAVDTATIVKLSRVLWIVPICIAASWWMRTRSPSIRELPRLPIPWFIALFLLAATARTLFPGRLSPAAPMIATLAASGMALALFLIGAALSRRALAEVGWRPMALGVALWVFIAGVSLAIVRAAVT